MIKRNPAIPRRYKGEGKVAYRVRLEGKHAEMVEYAKNERFSTLQRRSFRATARSLHAEITRLLKPGEK